MVIIHSFFIPPNFFIKKNIAKLEKNILNMSEAQINDHLKELYKLTKTDFFEIALLSTLLKRITKKKAYYHAHAYRNIVPKNIICIPLIKTIYDSLYGWYHPKQQEYKKYYEKFSFTEQKLQQKINTLHKKLLSKQ